MTHKLSKERWIVFTMSDTVALFEDAAVSSLMDRINELYPGLNITMAEYKNNPDLKGKARQDLCDGIEKNFSDRLNGRKLDVDLIYDKRDERVKNLFETKTIRAEMTEGIIDVLGFLKERSFNLVEISNNSLDNRIHSAIRSCTNDRGEELLGMFDMGFDCSTEKTPNTAKRLVEEAKARNVAIDDIVVVCRPSNFDNFKREGFNNIVVYVGSSPDMKQEAKDRLKERGAIILHSMQELPDFTLAPSALTETRGNLISRFRDTLTTIQLKR